MNNDSTKPEQSLQEWRDTYVRDVEHPVLAALAVRAAMLIERLGVWGQCGPESSQWWAELSEMPQLLAELLEITPWLPLLPGVPVSKREQKKLLERQLRNSDLSYDNGKAIMEAFSRSGAPSTARVRAVHGLEMLLAGADWHAIIEKLCPYPRPHVHTTDCRHAIRREILRLKHVLRKYSLMPVDTMLATRRGLS